MNAPDLIPGQALIYERANGVVYARYRDPPYNEMYERWIIGGDPEAVNKATGNLFSYSEWQDMMRIAKDNHTLRTQMKKLLDIYYIVKDDK
jgi:lysyl-tRNA synthetase class I